MAATAKFLVGGLKNIGSKIAGSMLGKAVKSIAGSKMGQSVSGLVKDKASSVTKFVNNRQVVQNVKSGINNFKTNNAVGKGLVKAGNSIKTAYNNADPSKSVVARSVNGIKTGANYVKNNIDIKQVGRGAMTAASVGVGYAQVISSHRQYKDSVARQDAYNAALKAEENAATAAKNQADAEYAARTDAYSAALATSQTSTQNIYSSGYAGDTIFSNSLIQPKYKII